MKAFFLHYKVVPAQLAAVVQGGFADVCCIAETLEDANAMATALIGHEGLAGELLSYRPSTPQASPDLDTTESTLLEKALLNTPQVALLLVEVTAAESHRPGAAETPTRPPRGLH